MTFAPTSHEGYPTTCFLCGRHASGIGIGKPPKQDPHYICEQCWPMIEYARSIRSFNSYERAAVTRAVTAVGPFVERLGTDLGEWSEEDAEAFVRTIWEACGDELRAVIKEGEVPF